MDPDYSELAEKFIEKKLLELDEWFLREVLKCGKTEHLTSWPDRSRIENIDFYNSSTNQS